MKKLMSTFLFAFAAMIGVQAQVAVVNPDYVSHSQWEGKKVAFLGDSMTEKWDAANYLFWENLADWMKIKPFVYGVNGDSWTGIYKQAQRLFKERGTDIDAIIIFAGTNDYNMNVPLGKFFDETMKETNANGNIVNRKYRVPVMNSSTFCGRINQVMDYLRTNFPDQQIIIMTPIHRGYAKFNENNVQPEESFANGLELYIDDYVNILKTAASIWSVPVIDLFTTSGLYPMKDAQKKYFRNKDTDCLHPATPGNFRLAQTIQYQLLALPSTFVGVND